MKFGVFDHMDDAGVPLGQLYADRLQLLEAYDRAGLHGYHLAEHHSTPLGCAASPGLFLAAAAQRTRTLRFGPLVYLLPFYHPLRLIEEICMLDQMSGGRLELGVGRGVSPFETKAYGLDFANTGEIYHEAFQLILKGLASDELTFEGKHYQFRQRADDPAAGAAPASAAVVRDHDPGECGLAGGKRREHRHHRIASDRARSSPIGIARCAPGSARLRPDGPLWAWPATWWWPIPTRRRLRSRDAPIRTGATASAGCSRATAPSRGSRRFIRPPSTSWPRSTTASPDRLARYATSSRPRSRRAASNYLLSWFAFGDMTLAESLRSVELFAREVMPAFANVRADAAE